MCGRLQSFIQAMEGKEMEWETREATLEAQLNLMQEQSLLEEKELLRVRYLFIFVL